MKKIFYLSALTTLLLSNLLLAQNNILFVNDNDNVTYNTDTIVNDLHHTTYAFDEYSIPLSATSPDSATLAEYDLVIWYASTDGVGLGFWRDGILDANTDLLAYVRSGKKLWVIGQDLLYSMYGSAPDLFVANEFVYDYMGLSYYGNQSLADDGGLGCPAAVPVATNVFQDTLTWIFATNWYMDGVTTRTGGDTLYEMGPASYPLSGEPTMVYYGPDTTAVMSTFFDPALIGSYTQRVSFLQKSLDYLSAKTVNLPVVVGPLVKAWYVPATTQLHISSSEPVAFSLCNLMGQTVATGNTTGNQAVDLQALPAGLYFLRAGEGQQVIKFVK